MDAAAAACGPTATAEDRRAVVADGWVAKAVTALQSDDHDAAAHTAACRLLRNVCVQCPEAQSACLEARAVAAALSRVGAHARRADGDGSALSAVAASTTAVSSPAAAGGGGDDGAAVQLLLRVAWQAVANMIAGHTAAQSSLWSSIIGDGATCRRPFVFCLLDAGRKDPALAGVVASVLHSCGAAAAGDDDDAAAARRERVARLAADGAVWQALLGYQCPLPTGKDAAVAAAAVEAGDHPTRHWAEWLVAATMRLGHLRTVYEAVARVATPVSLLDSRGRAGAAAAAYDDDAASAASAVDEDDAGAGIAVLEHVALLELACSAFEEDDDCDGGDTPLLLQCEDATWLLKTLAVLCSRALATSAPGFETAVLLRVIGMGCSVISAAVLQCEKRAAAVAFAPGVAVLAVPLCSLLRALTPPDTKAGSVSRMPVAAVAYAGLRTTITRCIALCAHAAADALGPALLSAVLSGGTAGGASDELALSPMLAQCRLDATEPTVREWALLAVRYLTELSAPVREYLAGASQVHRDAADAARDAAIAAARKDEEDGAAMAAAVAAAGAAAGGDV